jgi:uncharacterized protein (UPF0276 family)
MQYTNDKRENAAALPTITHTKIITKDIQGRYLHTGRSSSACVSDHLSSLCCKGMHTLLYRVPHDKSRRDHVCVSVYLLQFASNYQTVPIVMV